LVGDLPIGRGGSPTRSVPMRSRHSSSDQDSTPRAQPQLHSNNMRISRAAFGGAADALAVGCRWNEL